MAASVMARGTANLHCWVASHHRPLNPASASRLKGSLSLKPLIHRSFPIRIRAVDDQTDEENPSFDEDEDEPKVAFIPQEDVGYIWKLGGGSALGAAIIKYGSILFPQITTPNITQAFIIITTPLIIAVLLLIKASHVTVKQ